MVNREPNDKVLALPEHSPGPAASGLDFSVWVKAHQPRLVALARRLVWDSEEARDVVQLALAEPMMAEPGGPGHHEVRIIRKRDGNGPVDEDVQVR